jgi:hypothetical protein
MLLLITALACAGSVLAQPFGPSVKDKDKTRVLILGSPHLITAGRAVTEKHLRKVLAVLERFDPQVIGVESISPPALADMILRADDYSEAIEQFGGRRVYFGKKMQERLDLSWLEANAAARKSLKELGAEADQEQRAALIPVLIAAYDDLAALIQWARLPEAFRKTCKEIPAALQTYLQNRLKSPNEKISIGVALALRLGLERLHHIDDHYDKDLYLRIVEDLVTELKDRGADKGLEEAPFFKASQERREEAVKDGNLYPYFRYINSPEYGAEDAATQWDVWFRTGLESGLDRTRIALWEVRNLNMASHVRRATALIPGGRVLVIVGSGHKPFLEAYLNQMAGLKLVQFNDLPDPE